MRSVNVCSRIAASTGGSSMTTRLQKLAPTTTATTAQAEITLPLHRLHQSSHSSSPTLTHSYNIAATPSRTYAHSRPRKHHSATQHLLPRVALFHSRDQSRAAPPGPFGATESTLLSAAYAHVPTLGFGAAALARGARDAGLPSVSPAVLSDGSVALVRWHLETQLQALAPRARALFGAEGRVEEAHDGQSAVGESESIGIASVAAAATVAPGGAASEKQRPRATLSIPDKIEMLLWERLMGNRHVVDKWQEAVAILAYPSSALIATRMLARLADEIVFLAGDRAVDTSWYTTRAAVGAVYAASELFMTSDASGPGFDDTRAFLRRRMQEVKDARYVLSNMGEWVGFNAMAALNVARSWGVKI